MVILGCAEEQDTVNPDRAKKYLKLKKQNNMILVLRDPIVQLEKANVFVYIYSFYIYTCW